MKRIGNLYEQICSRENLELADKRARRGKRKQQRQIRAFDAKREALFDVLRDGLVNRKYRTSAYRTFKVFEPKERVVFELPYYPDRIVHHAVMNVLEPVFTAMFTADTYSCIKRKGIHGAMRGVKRALKDRENTRYCLKLDIKKFYPSVDHDILKGLLRRKFKDNNLLWLLDEIIDSAPGVPIGNYLSQYFANFYLTYFDHWVKEVKGVRYYFRYADDLVIFHSDKRYLHGLLAEIREYLGHELHLEVKGNYQVFPIAEGPGEPGRGLDFVGFVFYHGCTWMRKSIKQRFARMMARNPNWRSLASYRGWALPCNSYKLLKKLIHENKRSIIVQRAEHYPGCRRRGVHGKEKRDGGPGRGGNYSAGLQNDGIEVCREV